MAKIQDIDIPYLEFAEAAAPGTGASAITRIYTKSDGLMYSKDDAGTETLMSSGPSGAVTVKACRVKRDANMAITSGGVAVSWDNEVRDDGGFYAGGAPTRLTVPDTAWYQVRATFNNGASVQDQVVGWLRLNGTTAIDYFRAHETTNSVFWSGCCGGAFYLTAADYLELLVDTGTSQNITGETATPGALNMSIAKIG